MTVLNEELGNWLKMYRARHHLTQADLAERTGVTRKTINSVENRIFVPSTVLALKLAKALGVTVEELFYLTLDERAPRA